MPDLAIAVLGVGVHGSRYAEHLLRGDVPGARLAGVSRRDASTASRWTDRGVRFETDALALARDPSVEAVVVASVPGAHEAQALAVLEAGKPLLLEKPVAPDGPACARIAAAAERAGLPVLVGHSHRYNPVARAFRDEVRALGPLSLLSLSLRHERMPMAWQHRPPSGGALLSLGVHLADLARWATGEAIAAVESCDLDRGPGGAEDAAVALARLSSGARLLVEVSIVAAARRGLMEALGAEGAVDGDLVHHELARRRGRETTVIPLPPPVPGLVPLLRDFVAAARGGGSGDAATLSDGIAAVGFVEACRAAAR